ncbi:hypothetical protein NQ314_011125 [Rhamnusium bicolor]|uniref:PiggyBac transposable element-derived protein domain-containing protein n=1 Tax=Rhamnusium bicolor TaxID=1586634 RepID=A0AAV8XLJ6_9CUCU|nr:hypothetical protein NQ314_011125 [Rhamnusium bicolor]
MNKTFLCGNNSEKQKRNSIFIHITGRSQYESILWLYKKLIFIFVCPEKKGKIVVLLSCMHIDSNEFANDTEKKPEIIQFYNSTKSGVDAVNKLCVTYNVARSTRTWPMVIYYHLLM